MVVIPGHRLQAQRVDRHPVQAPGQAADYFLLIAPMRKRQKALQAMIAALKPQLIVGALGAAFFSLSLGAGTMLIYGSYIPDEGKLPMLGAAVTV